MTSQIFKKFVFFSARSDNGKYEIVKPGMVTPSQQIPAYIEKPEYFYEYRAPEIFTSTKPEIKRNNAINGVRESCRIAANILEKCESILHVSFTISAA